MCVTDSSVFVQNEEQWSVCQSVNTALPQTKPQTWALQTKRKTVYEVVRKCECVDDWAHHTGPMQRAWVGQFSCCPGLCDFFEGKKRLPMADESGGVGELVRVASSSHGPVRRQGGLCLAWAGLRIIYAAPPLPESSPRPSPTHYLSAFSPSRRPPIFCFCSSKLLLQLHISLFNSASPYYISLLLLLLSIRRAFSFPSFPHNNKLHTSATMVCPSARPSIAALLTPHHRLSQQSSPTLPT